jgi:two-component system, NtrC family, sensor kinase
LKPISIRINPVYLQQVVFNLVKNSCEAMENSGTIKIYQIDQRDFNTIDIVIEDSGPGISKNVADNVFKPFYSTKNELEGTGLGLYLCFQLMKKMDGLLIYDQSYIKGTRFILRFKNA